MAYPNLYQNYNTPYNYNQYQQPNYNYISQQQYQPQQIQYQQQIQQPQQGLIGKVVESIDIVRNTEIPIGGSAIFPQANMNAIFYKAWNPDGTTKIITYKPEVESLEEPIDSTLVSQLNSITESIYNIEKKIDSIKVFLLWMN